MENIKHNNYIYIYIYRRKRINGGDAPINLRNQHFQNAGRWARDRARGPHFENADFEGIGFMAATPHQLNFDSLGLTYSLGLTCSHLVSLGFTWSPSPEGRTALSWFVTLRRFLKTPAKHPAKRAPEETYREKKGKGKACRGKKGKGKGANHGIQPRSH